MTIADISLVIAASFFVVWTVYAVLSLAPWLPTRSKDLERIAQAANLKEGEVFYELGSGTGHVSIYIGKKYPQSQIVGIELSLVLYAIARFNVWRTDLANVKMVRSDIYSRDVSDASHIYVFATPHSAQRIVNYLAHSLRPGARVISYNFRLPFLSQHACEVRDEVKGGGVLYLYDMLEKGK